MLRTSIAPVALSLACALAPSACASNKSSGDRANSGGASGAAGTSTSGATGSGATGSGASGASTSGGSSVGGNANAGAPNGGASSSGGLHGNGGSVGGAGVGGSSNGGASGKGAGASNGGNGASGNGAGGNGASGNSAGGNGASGGDAGLPAKELLYVGGQATNGNGSAIAVYDLDTATWALSNRRAINVAGLVSFLAFTTSGNAGNYLYSTDEDQGMLRSFRLDATGMPVVINAVATSGHPTHVAVDPAGHFVFGADYNEGKVEVVSTDATFALKTGVDSETPGAQTHEVVLSPDGKYAFVPCKGSDKVAQFKYNASTGALDANTPPSVASASGAGPRHMAFTPNGKFAYVIDEVGGTMETMAYDAASGTLTRKGAITTLPSGFTGSNTSAEVAVLPSGKFVYGSNRFTGASGDLVIYSAAADGTLTLVGHESTRGQTPRHFSLERSGRALFVANVDSGTLVVFTINGTTGKLTFATQTDVGMKPYYAGTNPAP